MILEHEGLYGIEKEVWQRMQEYPQITSLKEAKLLLGTENRYGIYQIIDGSSGREYKFMDLNFIERHGYQVKKEDYELIYSDGMYYGDTLDFLELESELNRKEVAYRIGDQYFSIQVATEGYDYSFYDKEYKLMDGGILDDPDISMRQAIQDVLEKQVCWKISLKNPNGIWMTKRSR